MKMVAPTIVVAPTEETLQPLWSVSSGSDSGCDSGPEKRMHPIFIAMIIVAIVAAVAVIVIVIVLRAKARKRGRFTDHERQSREPLVSPVGRVETPCRRNCRRFIVSAVGIFVITSEFTGTALLLWFGEQP